MTNEEAIEWIQGLSDGWDDTTNVTACSMAINALEQEPILDKIRAKIEQQEKWLMIAGYNAYNADIAFNAIKSEVAKYKAESENEK